MNYTYILRCADGTLYTGWTNDLEKRLLAHNGGDGAKYTRSRLPVELVYYERYGTKEEAMSREWHIKRMTRPQKMKLISGSAPPDTEGEGGSCLEKGKVFCAGRFDHFKSAWHKAQYSLFSMGSQREHPASLYHSSSLSTARNASVGICTEPSWRIFFLPSFCFSRSFFFLVMSPP